jgi:hypothetical protein
MLHTATNVPVWEMCQQHTVAAYSVSRQNTKGPAADDATEKSYAMKRVMQCSCFCRVLLLRLCAQVRHPGQSTAINLQTCMQAKQFGGTHMGGSCCSNDLYCSLKASVQHLTPVLERCAEQGQHQHVQWGCRTEALRMQHCKPSSAQQSDEQMVSNMLIVGDLYQL